MELGSDMTWDLRSNIKAKPGSQGTLFQGGTDQMSERRYPRGYTPERLAEVFPHVGVMKYYVQGEHGKAQTTGPQRRDLIDTIARSTVPVEHLEGVKWSPGQSSSKPTEGGIRETSGAYHWHGFDPRQKSAPAIAIREGFETDETPIHELGHHVSATSGTEHSAYDTDERRGAEEAFADNYADEHFRDRRGKANTFHSLYADGVPYRDETRNAAFMTGYRGRRVGETSDRAIYRRAAQEDQIERDNPTLPGLEHTSYNPRHGELLR